MKDFRNDLLELLLEHSGEDVDIMPIVEKHFGDIKTFEPDTDTVPRYRLRINQVLKELTEMKWVNVAPQNGFSNGHHMNHSTMRREFILDHPVKVRMTTTGEIEYKKMKKEQEPEKPSIHVAGDIVGSIVGSHVHDLDFRPDINPPIQPTTAAPKAGKKTLGGKSIINKVIIPLLVALIAAYLIYRFGWNR